MTVRQGSLRRVAAAVALASNACAPAPAPPAPALAPTASREAPARGPCVELPRRVVAGSHDVDGDGTPDAFVEERGRLSLYLGDRRGDCGVLTASVPLDGPLAFIHVAHEPSGTELRVETWLMHGDRRSVRYRYRAGHLDPIGRAVEIRGPRPR